MARNRALGFVIVCCADLLWSDCRLKNFLKQGLGEALHPALAIGSKTSGRMTKEEDPRHDHRLMWYGMAAWNLKSLTDLLVVQIWVRSSPKTVVRTDPVTIVLGQLQVRYDSKFRYSANLLRRLVWSGSHHLIVFPLRDVIHSPENFGGTYGLFRQHRALNIKQRLCRTHIPVESNSNWLLPCLLQLRTADFADWTAIYRW